MLHESKSAAWIRPGGNSIFVLPMGPVQAPEVKFSVVPDRLLDSIIDDALAAGVARLNGFLPEGVSIDITSVDLTAIRDKMRNSVADRLNETGVPVMDCRANRLVSNFSCFRRNPDEALPAACHAVPGNRGAGVSRSCDQRCGETDEPTPGRGSSARQHHDRLSSLQRTE